MSVRNLVLTLLTSALYWQHMTTCQRPCFLWNDSVSVNLQLHYKMYTFVFLNTQKFSVIISLYLTDIESGTTAKKKNKKKKTMLNFIPRVLILHYNIKKIQNKVHNLRIGLKNKLKTMFNRLKLYLHLTIITLYNCEGHDPQYLCTWTSLSKINSNKRNKKSKNVIRDIKQQSGTALIKEVRR